MPRLVAATGVPERYAGCTLAGFDVNDPDERQHAQLVRARELSRRYVDEFLSESGQRQDRGLLFVGPPGVGKTHLAVAVLLELVKRYRLRAKFRDFTSLIHEIQSTFDSSSRDSKHDVLDPVMHADLLVLDELGAQKPTPWVTDTLYLILNRRYNERLPTIFTTNFRMPGSGAAGGAQTAPTAGEPGGGAMGGRAGGGGMAARIAPSLDRPGERGGGDRGVGDRGLRREGPELLTHRIPAALVSRLYEMARPIVVETDDFRVKVKMHARRS